MITLAEAVVKFSSNGVETVTSAINTVSNRLDHLSDKSDKTGISLGKLVAGNVIANIFDRLANNAYDLGKNILEMGMSFQTTNAQFEALGMNANTTRDFISRVAAASTLTTKELTSLATSVQLSGFNINRVLPAFAKLADLAGKDQDKLQGMVRLLNVLKTGARPDQELLQSLKMPTLLSEAGLKFDKGKLVGDINSALESVIKVIESKTGKVSAAMNKTFEASFSSLTDQFDKLKETLGSKILDWLKPWVDSLRVVLEGLTSSGIWSRFLDKFFYYGDAANKKLKDGILNQETLFAISDFIVRILSNLAFLPARIQAIFKEIVPMVKEIFNNLKEDPTIKGFLTIFEKIGKQEQKNAYNERFFATAQKLFEKGQISSPNMVSGADKKIVEMTMQLEDKKSKGIGATAGLAQKLNNISEEQRKFYATESLKARSAILGLGKTPIVQGTGKVVLPGTPLGDKTEVDKDKKKKEKDTSLLELIVQNTQKANELTLRNMTYGGGQLAAQGVSQVQMSGYRSAKSPQINASNDIVRGVEKLNRSQNMSNNLNFNFRRA